VKHLWSEEKLDQLLSTPSLRLIEDMKKISGDIMILGAGGKMGPTLAVMAKRAADAAGINKKIYAVSRFSDPKAIRQLQDKGICCISADLLETGALSSLPDVENIIFMAGRKFGTEGQEPLTWAMNAWLPAMTAERFRQSRIVVFSSGNIYPLVPVASGGADETVPPAPIGEYNQSVLARERCFEYAAGRYGTNVLLFRLSYAVALRYGVLFDIASKVYAGETIHISNPAFNCIWQGDACEAAIRCLLHTASPAAKLNVTGPETVSVRYAAAEFGRLFGKEVHFSGEESADSYLWNASRCVGLLGYPTVSLAQMMAWQAQWIAEGGSTLNKPTHFEERKGSY